jgi:hypothetical protein
MGWTIVPDCSVSARWWARLFRRVDRGTVLFMVAPAHALAPVLAVGLALTAGCQRLAVEDPVDPWQDLPEDDTGAGTFLPGDEDDDGGALELGCDPIEQSGCDPGQKCAAVKVPGIFDAYACVTDPGGLEPFSPCNASLHDGVDGCPPSYVCLEGAEAGTCVPLCLSGSDCDDGQCVYHSVDVIRHCADECNPFQSACVSPMECRRASDRFLCKFPTVGDIGTQNDPCEVEEDFGCAAGFVCIPGALVPGCSEGSCCSTLCDLSGGDPCPGASTCNTVLTSPAPGFDGIGACFVPA